MYRRVPSTCYLSYVAHRLSSVVADDKFNFRTFASISKWRWLQLPPHEISKVICTLKPVIHSCDIHLVYMYLVLSIKWCHSGLKTKLYYCPLLHPYVRRSHKSARLVLIVCRQFVNYAIALKFFDNMYN